MPDGRERSNHEVASATVAPGALTALLREIAAVPPAAGAPPAGGGSGGSGVGGGTGGPDGPPSPGDRVGRFEVVREIGRGGFGAVYEARDLELGRSVALKLVRRAWRPDVKEERLLAEAEAAARLAHPNIVMLHDVGRSPRGPYLVMELLRGATLAERLAEAGRLPPREALRTAVEASRGLAHAHAQGVVHRDLKPGNVFLCDDGQVKVLDFGLALVFGRTGPAGGTPAYMAPEQLCGEPGDARADVYALGATLHELLAGSPPYQGEAERGVPPGGAPPPIPGAPAALVRILGRGLARDPAERFANGGEAHQALADFQKSIEPRRRAWVAWSIAALALAAAVGFWMRPQLPPGRLLTAIADADVQAEESGLGDLSLLLHAALEPSGRVSLLSRTSLLGFAPGGAQARPARLDASRAAQAARAAGAKALILPAVRRDGADYELEVRALEPERDRPLFTVRERAGGKGGLLDALDRLADRVRAELGEGRASVAAPRVRLAAAFDPTSEAWRHYAEGQRLWSEWRQGEAQEAWERALAADPDFPLAHLRKAQAMEYLDREAVERHLEAAMRGIGRLPPMERALAEAKRAELLWNFPGALDAYDRVIQGWPDDPQAYNSAGHIALRLLAEPERARPYLERLVALRAAGPALLLTLVELGRLDEALDVARRAAEERPGRGTFAALARVRRIRGETAESLAAARRALSFDRKPPGGAARLFGQFWSFVEAGALAELEREYAERGEGAEEWARAGRDGHSWELLTLRGRWREALAALEARAPPPDAPAQERGFHHGLRAAFPWGRGDAGGVWREARASLELGSATAECLGYLLDSLGDLEHGARIAALLKVQFGEDVCGKLHRHLRGWKTGRAEEAARGLAAMYGPEPAYFLGLVLLDLGRDREAVEAFRRFRRAPEFNYAGGNVITWPRSLYLEAAALERLGDRDEARRALDRLLRIWARADRDLPLLAEARALRARLGP